jgi:hypothetical protein
LDAREVADSVQKVIQAHHDAFAVELVGRNRVRLPDVRIQELLDLGYLEPDAANGLRVRGVSGEIDPFHFTQRVATAVNQASPELRKEMRDWPLSRWAREVDVLSTGAGELGRADIVVPQPPPTPATQITGSGSYKSVVAPVDLSTAAKNAYVQAVTRAGEFARGLGNTIAEATGALISERWAGAEIEAEVSIEQRARMLETIRDKTGRAIVERQSARDLASELGNATKDWSRDWGRIAKTEIQGSYNEGVVMDAVNNYGEDARVARIPESNACVHCQRVFLGENGAPVVFYVRDLLGNGTNVGKRALQWQATIWPVHPNCRCDTQLVPPGMTVDEEGALIMERE